MKTLQELVTSCRQCRKEFEDNVRLLVPDDWGTLTTQQERAVIDHLNRQHKEKHRAV